MSGTSVWRFTPRLASARPPTEGRSSSPGRPEQRSLHRRRPASDSAVSVDIASLAFQKSRCSSRFRHRDCASSFLGRESRGTPSLAGDPMTTQWAWRIGCVPSGASSSSLSRPFEALETELRVNATEQLGLHHVAFTLPPMGDRRSAGSSVAGSPSREPDLLSPLVGRSLPSCHDNRGSSGTPG